MKINQESKISQQMPRTRWFHGKLYQIFKEELIPIHFKLLQKKKKGGGNTPKFIQGQHTLT